MLDLIHNQLKSNPTLLIDVKVTPKSRQNQLLECFEQLNGRIMLRVKIQGAPVKGKVNAELIDFLAQELGIAKSKLQLVAGLTSRHKILKITS